MPRATIEPRPGIPPSPGHTVELIQHDEAREREGDPGRTLLRPEDARTPSRGRPAAQVVVMLPSVGGEKEVTDYFKLFDYDIRPADEGLQSQPLAARRSRMEFSPFLLAPFVASLILTGIHAYLGVHVVERGVIFVDLALAQIAALGATIAILIGMDPHGGGAYWISLAFTFLGAAIFSLVRMRRGAYPAGSLHRHCLRRGLGRRDPGHEQGHRRDRAPEGHAGRQHPGGLLAGGRRRTALLYGGIGVFHYIFRKKFLLISMNPTSTPRARASRSASGTSSSTPPSASWSPRRWRSPACCWSSAT